MWLDLCKGCNVPHRFMLTFPKYYTTPRTIPIMDEEGKRNFVKINQDDGLPFDFDTSHLM